MPTFNPFDIFAEDEEDDPDFILIEGEEEEEYEEEEEEDEETDEGSSDGNAEDELAADVAAAVAQAEAEQAAIFGDTSGSDTDEDSETEVEEEAFGKPASMVVDADDVDSERMTSGDQSSAPNCPICFEPWSSGGRHRICSIPCGHVYGRSCLERWAQRSHNKKGKCPQCNREFKEKDIINLYAPVLFVGDDKLEKELQSLREKNDILALENKSLLEEISNLKKQQRYEEDFERQKRACLGQLSSQLSQRKLFEHHNESSGIETLSLPVNDFHAQSHHQAGWQNCSFILQHELAVNGARVLGIDSSNRMLVIAGKAPGIGGDYVLSKISMFAPSAIDVIQLPHDTGPVRDLNIVPGRLVLIASLGKKLSLMSMETNHAVLSYNLQAPAWSCSSDCSSPYHVYAGLQNGMLMVFDIRQTAQEVASIAGISRHPIHTIHSTVQNGVRKRVLTASSVGPCLWDISNSGERPSLIPGMDNEGICISLAYDNSNDELVASFRPKVEHFSEAMGSQSSPVITPASEQGKMGSYIFMKKVNNDSFQRSGAGYGYVSEVRMLKSAVIHTDGYDPLFAYGDESVHGICLSHLPSFQSYTRLRPHPCPILDLKYASSTGPALLGCISEQRLQLFSCYA